MSAGCPCRGPSAAAASRCAAGRGRWGCCEVWAPACAAGQHRRRELTVGVGTNAAGIGERGRACACAQHQGTAGVQTHCNVPALTPELHRLAAVEPPAAAAAFTPGAAAASTTERSSWAAAEMASRLLTALPGAALQAAAQTVLVAATTALADAGAAAETQQTAALKRKLRLRREQQRNLGAGTTARGSLDMPVSDLHAGVVDLAVAALVQEWGLTRKLHGSTSRPEADSSEGRSTALSDAARASLVAAGPAARRFLRSYYRGAAADDAAAPDGGCRAAVCAATRRRSQPFNCQPSRQPTATTGARADVQPLAGPGRRRRHAAGAAARQQH